ncbi:hypothetical protein V6N13_091756 [Hibiscus sabdariffa]
MVTDPNMFSKLHSHPFHVSYHDSNSKHPPTLLTAGRNGGGGVADGASIEVVRRPRGRPPGSKNKPKRSVLVYREPNPPMNPYVLEIPGENDLVEAISGFSRRKNIKIYVLNGSGTVPILINHKKKIPVYTYWGGFEC